MIDWDRVWELRDEVGAEDFAEVVDLFLSEVEAELTELLEPADAATLENRLHFLKGSALNLGFRKFSNACFEGERASSQGQSGSVDLAEIVTLYETSKTVFLEELATRF